jgi:hypothetical protein
MSAGGELYSDLATDLALYTETRQAQEHMAVTAERWHETCELVAALGNHEAKGILLLDLWQQGIFLSGNQMVQSINRRQAAEPGWLPKSRSLFFAYCQNSLEPSGLVESGTAQLHATPINAYKISQPGIAAGVPAAGLLLDWGLRYPNLSTQTLLGPTNSRGSTRAVETRANLLLDMLSHPLPGRVSVSALAGLSETHFATVVSTVDQLVKIGLLKKESVLEDNTRQYRALSTQHEGNHHLESFRADTQLLYQFLATLKVGQVFTQQEAIDYVIAGLTSLSVDFDAAEIRQHLSNNLSAKGQNKFPEVERLELYNDGGFTKLTLSEDSVEAVRELMNILLAINDQTPPIMAQGRDLAQTIINTPKLVAQLMLKAHDFSPNAEANLEQVSSTLKSVISKTKAPLTAAQVNAKYAEISGRSLSKTALLHHLGRLCGAGEIGLAQRRSDPSRKRLSNYYFPLLELDNTSD